LDLIAEYGMKVMDIDTDPSSIPNTEYDVCIIMPAAKFTRIVCDLHSAHYCQCHSTAILGLGLEQPTSDVRLHCIVEQP